MVSAKQILVIITHLLFLKESLLKDIYYYPVSWNTIKEY